MHFALFVFFKQKTAYELRISDWSSDVCSSDLLQAMEGSIDVVVQPLGAREKKLLVADMDSTMITVACIDELADYAGLKAQIAEVTQRARRGELDFAEALRSRVALMKGLYDRSEERGGGEECGRTCWLWCE